MGYLLADGHRLKNRLTALEEKLELVIQGLSAREPKSSAAGRTAQGRTDEPPLPVKKAVVPAAADVLEKLAPPLAAKHAPALSQVVETIEEMNPPAVDSDTESFLSDGPAPADDWIQRVRSWLVSGNPVARIGIVILFFGVAFLLKYAAEHRLLPIEFRLAGAFLAGMGMLGIGWRLRNSRRMFALLLQGGGVGIMYLTLFAAARLYALVPMPLTFALLVVLVTFSAVLAVLQDALPMAQFGVAGGFLAPILTSTGSGSHVMLFSYYALLNAGIVGIAWFRSWRTLNLTGFIFTFGIGALWGWRAYRPVHFASTEPFLILFFLFYIVIAVLFTHRGTSRLSGYVDGSLVFGVPLATFSLQAGLVRNHPYGIAISALVMGGFYIGLARWLWQRGDARLRLMVEAFLALGVVFASVAIPLGLDGRWTAAAWGLEGAALVWVGLRQQRLTARCFGLVLQIGAGIAFISAIGGPTGQIPVLNGVCLGGVLLSLAALASGYLLWQRGEVLKEWEKSFPVVVSTIGLLWWLGIGLMEIDRHVPGLQAPAASLLFVAISLLVLTHVGQKLQWPFCRFPPIGLLPVMVAAHFAFLERRALAHPLSGVGLLAWPLALAIFYHLMKVLENGWDARVVRWWHTLSLWLCVVLLLREVDWLMADVIGAHHTWRFAVWGLVAGVCIMGLSRLADRIVWPFRAHPEAYGDSGLGICIIAGALWGWIVIGCLAEGTPKPLEYLPLINPLELTGLFAIYVLTRWMMRQAKDGLLPDTVIKWALAAALFGMMNAVTARCVHTFGEIAWSHRLFEATPFQSAIAVLWAIIALGAMVWAARSASRPVWFAAAGLLGVDVVKLFIVDLSGSGSISRIVSFIAVGALMLLVGFFSPLPPASGKAHDR
ncbi:MAG: DUF2339 domain-containing protein [Pseudomonadota bacterium]